MKILNNLIYIMLVGLAMVNAIGLIYKFIFDSEDYGHLHEHLQNMWIYLLASWFWQENYINEKLPNQ